MAHTKEASKVTQVSLLGSEVKDWPMSAIEKGRRLSSQENWLTRPHKEASMERDVLANAASRAGLAPPGDDSTGEFDVGVVEGVLTAALFGWCLSKIQCFNLWR